MKKILLIGVGFVLLTAGTVLAGKPQPEPSASGNMELVGFTTATTTPNVGLFALTQLCQAEYLDSRMCTTEEVMKTVNIPVLPDDTVAWIQPIIVSQYNEVVRDISGIGLRTGSSYLSCAGWSVSYLGDYSLNISNLGIIGYSSCANTHPVACCAPAQ